MTTEDAVGGTTAWGWGHRRNKVSHREALAAAEELLRYIEGVPRDEVLREGLRETAMRVVRSFEELFAGYRDNPAEHLKLFEAGSSASQIVLVKDIEFSSTCEHHLQPFMGSAHIAYIPGAGSKVLGVSKLVRLLECFAKRLQIQERIGEQVVDALFHGVPGCTGAAVILEAKHLCMTCRGVKKQHSSMVTSSLRGAFYDDPGTRAELISLIKV